MHEVTGEAVDLVISFEATPGGRLVRDIIQVERFINGQYEIEYDQLTEEQARAALRAGLDTLLGRSLRGYPYVRIALGGTIGAWME